MSRDGTAAYDGLGDIPPLVRSAVEQARDIDLGLSCLPSHGRLLQVLAGGVDSGVIGETGTGAGVGLAWLVSGARPGVRVVSIERDAGLVATARSVFVGIPTVEVLHGDWHELRTKGPFDLLALDGGGQGKRDEPPIDPEDWLRPGGVVVLDDFTPSHDWPPLHEGVLDIARLYWLQNPKLLSTEPRLSLTLPRSSPRYMAD